MTENEPHSPMLDHFNKKRDERLREAELVWPVLVEAGLLDGMAVILDFVLYGRDEQAAKALAQQIKQTYLVSIAPIANEGWMIAGTTRPYGSKLTESSHRDWVRFMCELGTSHGYVLSAWTLEAPELQTKVSSAAFEAGAGGTSGLTDSRSR